jgi:hypothetical protein
MALCWKKLWMLFFFSERFGHSGGGLSENSISTKLEISAHRTCWLLQNVRCIGTKFITCGMRAYLGSTILERVKARY